LTRVYHYSKKYGSVNPLGGASKEVAEKLETISHYFSEKKVTSNIIEQQFSSLKRLVNFSGKRSIDTWNLILTFYFTMREYPGAVEQAIEKVKVALQIVHRSPNLVLRLAKIANNFSSKLIKVEVAN